MSVGNRRLPLGWLARVGEGEREYKVTRGGVAQGLLTFAELRDVVGFDDYYVEEDRYRL